jgi:hypothetical protein
MRVSMVGVYDRKRSGYAITTRLHVTDDEARTLTMDAATERATVLHARAEAKLRDRILADDARGGKKRPRRIEVAAAWAELGDVGDAVVDVLATARNVNAPNHAAIEGVRTMMRAALLQKYAALGITLAERQQGIHDALGVRRDP